VNLRAQKDPPDVGAGESSLVTGVAV